MNPTPTIPMPTIRGMALGLRRGPPGGGHPFAASIAYHTYHGRSWQGRPDDALACPACVSSHVAGLNRSRSVESLSKDHALEDTDREPPELRILRGYRRCGRSDAGQGREC